MTKREDEVTPRILLVDDHVLFRESLRRLLEADARYVMVGEFGDAETAIRSVEGGLEFDLALIDYQLGGGVAGATSGLDVLRVVRRVKPEAPVLMVTAGMEHARLMEAVRELRAGVFLKNEPSAELLVAMERTLRGEIWVSSGAAMAMIANEGRTEARRPDGRAMRLTPREAMVLRGVLEGLSNKEIAARLESTESAVKSVIQKLFEKAGVRSRSQLVRIAIEMRMEDELAM